MFERRTRLNGTTDYLKFYKGSQASITNKVIRECLKVDCMERILNKPTQMRVNYVYYTKVLNTSPKFYLGTTYCFVTQQSM